MKKKRPWELELLRLMYLANQNPPLIIIANVIKSRWRNFVCFHPFLNGKETLERLGVKFLYAPIDKIPSQLRDNLCQIPLAVSWDLTSKPQADDINYLFLDVYSNLASPGYANHGAMWARNEQTSNWTRRLRLNSPQDMHIQGISFLDGSSLNPTAYTMHGSF